MALSDAGRNAIVDALTAIGFTPFDAANAYIGAGSSGTAFVKSHTDLQGGSKTRKGMDVGWPLQPSADEIELQATFGLLEANHAWLEWGVFNASTGGVMLSRKAEPITGTPKDSTEAWQFNVTLTIDNP